VGVQFVYLREAFIPCMDDEVSVLTQVGSSALGGYRRT
jgi:hypothetical protein